MYGRPPRAPEDECSMTTFGHVAHRVGSLWVCMYCGAPIKPYNGP